MTAENGSDAEQLGQGDASGSPWPRWGGLMAAAQEGDREAYHRLLSEILPVLRSWIGLKVRNASSAEDVVQEILLSLHRSRHTYRPERPFGPWLRSVARNASIDFFRSQGRRWEGEGHPMQESVAAELALAGQAQHQQQQELPFEEGAEGLDPVLRKALASLPPKQREAVELLQIEDLSVAEAAGKLGISSSALKVRAHRGYQALRVRLGGGKGKMGNKMDKKTGKTGNNNGNQGEG
ncbi:MAG: sigma-70 family RNA polymerase sigma factor [Deltaproteobacteria bacterium]|nr:sigma-70 family RNA polymerase sigma factor [Deltaproteobacteria bacterium]